MQYLLNGCMTTGTYLKPVYRLVAFRNNLNSLTVFNIFYKLRNLISVYILLKDSNFRYLYHVAHFDSE